MAINYPCFSHRDIKQCNKAYISTRKNKTNEDNYFAE